MDIDERFLTLSQVATALKVDVRVVRSLIDTGELRGFQVRRQWRVEVTEFEAYIDRQYRRATETIAAQEPVTEEPATPEPSTER